MEEFIKMMKREYPLWCAKKSLEQRPADWERQLNGRTPNATKISLAAAKLKSLTTAQA